MLLIIQRIALFRNMKIHNVYVNYQKEVVPTRYHLVDQRDQLPSLCQDLEELHDEGKIVVLAANVLELEGVRKTWRGQRATV